MYYKIIKDNKIVDVNNQFFHHRKRGPISDSPEKANLIRLSSGEFCRAPWTAPLPEEADYYPLVNAVLIEEDEYLKLREELNLGPVIQEEPVGIKEEAAAEVPDQPVVEEPKVITAADLQAKIDQLEALVKQLLSQN